jgi:hypothetical protein
MAKNWEAIRQLHDVEVVFMYSPDGQTKLVELEVV